MEWTWTTFFWWFVLAMVFKAILDRITGYKKFQKRVEALETLVAAQTKSIKTLNDNQQTLAETNRRLMEQSNNHRDHILSLTRALNEVAQSYSGRERHVSVPPQHPNTRSALRPTPEPEEPTRPAPMGDGRRIINLDDD